MNITVATIGTRGDIQPMLALAVELKNAGHTVCFGAPENFQDFIEEYGLTYFKVGSDFKKFIEDSAKSATKKMGSQKAYSTFLKNEARIQFPLLLEGSKDADILIGCAMLFAGPSVAEKLNIPYRYVMFTPTAMPSRYSPPPTNIPWNELPSWLNALIWNVSRFAFNKIMKKTMLSERAKMGLGPFKDYWNYVISDKIILATDPAASTVPDDVEQEWEQTGAFILPIVETALDPKLEAFLAAGEPPVFIGLGSMPSDDPDKTTRIFAEVVQSLGRRVILYQGWANLGNLKLPDNCLVIQGAPHQLLFPRLSAIVHHGGGGTTAAAIRAGVPQVVISVLGDQHYWGYQMTRLGVAPDFIPFPKLNSKRLLEAVHKCLHSKELGLKAKKLASEVNDGGTLEAVKIIESLAGKKFGD